MAVTEDEKLASLALLVTVASADRPFSPEECAALRGELDGADLPHGVTPESLLAGAHDLDGLLRSVVSQEARQAVLRACLAVADADRGGARRARRMLGRMTRAWGAPRRGRVLARLLRGVLGWAGPTSQVPDSGPNSRTPGLDEGLLHRSALSMVLGLGILPSTLG